MKTSYRVLTLLIVLLLPLAACARGDKPAQLSDAQQTAVYATVTAIFATTPSPTPEPSPQPSPTPAPTATKVITSMGPSNFPAGVNPLTGLAVSDPNLLVRRPVLVKVANYPAFGRPHGGLSFADIVWEYYIGGGSNRFIALYYGQNCNEVWPVRSVRLVDPQIAKMYQGSLVFSGGDAGKVMPTVLNAMGNLIITEDNYPAIRDNGNGNVTRLYADTAATTQMITERGLNLSQQPNLDGMLFDTVAPAGGSPATKATLFFNDYDKGDWVYDATSGKYLRWIEDGDTYVMIPLTDRITGQQLAFSNVIMIYANHLPYEEALIDIEIQNNNVGRRAVMFRDGQAYVGSWKTSDPQKPMQFFDAQGNLFPLKPGNTWVGILGGASVEQSDNGEWHFTFAMP